MENNDWHRTDHDVGELQRLREIQQPLKFCLQFRIKSRVLRQYRADLTVQPDPRSLENLGR